MTDKAAGERTAGAELRAHELFYWLNAVDLVTDMISNLKAEEFEGRRDKLVTTLKAASFHVAALRTQSSYQSAASKIHPSCALCGAFLPLVKHGEVLKIKCRKCGTEWEA